MDENWVKNTLASHVTGEKLVLSPEKNGVEQWVSIENFVKLFASVTTPNYTTLVAADAEKMGYKPYLDLWKTEGLIT